MKGWAGRTRGQPHLKGCAGAWLCRLTPASILAAETHLPPDHRDAYRGGAIWSITQHHRWMSAVCCLSHTAAICLPLVASGQMYLID